jgi:hypothetical protein
LKRSRRAVLSLAVVAVILASSAVIAGYIYVSPPVRSELGIIAEDQQADRTPPFTGVMILCPSKAREMGLCTPSERDLHAKYSLTVSPPPIARNLAVTCEVILVMKPAEPAFSTEVLIPKSESDRSSDFTCSHTAPQEGKFELDLTFIADPENGLSIAQYVLIVTIGYDEPLLSWMPLVTRKVGGAGIGDLCLLGYHIGEHPPPGTAKSENPLGEFRSCEEAVSWQRQMLGISFQAERRLCFAEELSCGATTGGYPEIQKRLR